MRGEESSVQRGAQAGRGATVPGNAEVGRIVEQYIRNAIGDPRQLREKIEALSGERGTGAAAKKSMLSAVTESLPAEPKSRQAAAEPPTKAEHDALVEDVHAIFAAINAMRVLL